MSIVVKPCEPPPSASALGHCDCWVWSGPCCWCGANPDGEVDEDELHGCGSWQ